MNLARLLHVLLICILAFPLTDALAQGEETEDGPTTISMADIINGIETRCPCADIDEGEAEEALEDDDADESDSVEGKSNGYCRSKIANPGKFKQGIRFLLSLGMLQLEEGEDLKSVFAAFKEARKDCNGKGNSGNGNGNGNGNGGNDNDDSDS